MLRGQSHSTPKSRQEYLCGCAAVQVAPNAAKARSCPSARVGRLVARDIVVATAKRHWILDHF